MSKTRGEILLEWTQRINEVEANGYEIRRYCLDRGLKEKRYYNWRRKIREAKEPERCFTKLSFTSEKGQVFAGFKIEFGNGICIIPERAFDEYEFLRAVRILQKV